MKNYTQRLEQTEQQIEAGKRDSKVMEAARKLLAHYSKIGFNRFQMSKSLRFQFPSMNGNLREALCAETPTKYDNK